MKKSKNLKKYFTKNPIKRHLIKKFLITLTDKVSSLKPGSILELGCGEGVVTYLLRKKLPSIPFIAMDINPYAITIAKKLNPDVDFIVGDASCIAFANNKFDLVICSEVLEHVLNPNSVLSEIHRISYKHAVLSVPNEPYFRISNLLMLNHLASIGNAPNHIHQWSYIKFAKLIDKYFKIKDIYKPFPWTIIVATASQ